MFLLLQITYFLWSLSSVSFLSLTTPNPLSSNTISQKQLSKNYLLPEDHRPTCVRLIRVMVYCWGARSRDPISQDRKIDSSLFPFSSFPPSESNQLVQYNVLLSIFRASSPTYMAQAPVYGAFPNMNTIPACYWFFPISSRMRTISRYYFRYAGSSIKRHN